MATPETAKPLHANTLQSVLQATLRLIEESPSVSKNSVALQSLRLSVAAMIAELEDVAKDEAPSAESADQPRM